MTTLVWCGRYLAADRRHQSGSVPHYDACKIASMDGAFYASMGPMAWMDAWIEWDTNGADPHGKLPVSGLDGHQGGLIRLRDGKCEMLDFRLPYWTTAGPRWAFGSGADFALAAMACGKNAMEAVEIAAQFDTCTGGGVDFVDLEAPEKGVQRWDGVMPGDKFDKPIFRDCGCTGYAQACMQCHSCFYYYGPETRKMWRDANSVEARHYIARVGHLRPSKAPSASIWRDCEPVMTTGRWPGYPTGD